jgi:predicted short-subunit dehydrogenase-like oxidoreductase (DUF2520 family)
MALAMRAKGADLVAYSCLTAEGRERARRFLGLEATPDLATLAALKPDVYLITVPDASLSEVAAKLAHEIRAHGVPSGDVPLVLHTSGANSVEELASCADAGATVLAFHPLQTFSEPLTGSTRFAGSAVAVTPGPGPHYDRARDFGFSLARSLGSQPFLLEDDHKVLYHAAACVASNYLVTLEHQARRIFVDAGMPRDEAMAYFMPLVRGAIDNLALQGPVAALTGPLSRGDSNTIAAHLRELEDKVPDLVSLYRTMGLATLDLVRARDEVSSEQIADLVRILGGPAPTAPTASMDMTTNDDAPAARV